MEDAVETNAQLIVQCKLVIKNTGKSWLLNKIVAQNVRRMA